MSKRAEDAVRILRGLGLVTAKAAADNRILRKLCKEDLNAMSRAADGAKQSSQTVQNSFTGTDCQTNGGISEPSSPPPVHATIVRDDSHAVAAFHILHGSTRSTGRQMLFQTTAKHLESQYPVYKQFHSAEFCSSATINTEPSPMSNRTVQYTTATSSVSHPFQPRSMNHAQNQTGTSSPNFMSFPHTSETARPSGTTRGYAADTPAPPPPPKIARRKFRERAVPSTQLGRAAGFAQLGAGMVVGAATEYARRAVSPGDAEQGSPFLSTANSIMLANALCRMRGAALKLGQMLSIQDEEMLPPQVAAALEAVRASADVMPRKQLKATLDTELGVGWESKVAHFDWEPSAAASIGQVHQATLHDGRTVAVKVQYPGVADSINSDVDNLMRLMSMTNVFPKGMYVERVMEVAKRELALECDYRNEAAAQKRMKALVEGDADMAPHFVVPGVVDELCSSRVLCSEWVPGTAIDSVKDMPDETRQHVGTLLLTLTLKELFTWRFMQTDPNWGNFLYDKSTGKVSLIDFGAAQEFPKPFVDDYLRMVKACADKDRDEVIHRSIRLGFLTGEEVPVMMDAHVEAGAAVGVPFGTPGVYDFSSHQALTKRVSALGATMLQHRLTPPPEVAYALHRRLSGAFLVNIKLKAKVECSRLFNEVYDAYPFGDDSVGSSL